MATNGNDETCNVSIDETVCMKATNDGARVIGEDSNNIELKFEIKQLKWLAGVLFAIIVLLVLYGLYMGLNNGFLINDDNGNKSQYNIFGGECTINGTNITKVIEDNLLLNNESANFTDLLLTEYLLSIDDDGHGTGTVENENDTMKYDIDDSGDNDRRLLQSCSSSFTSYYGGTGGGSFSLTHPTNPCLKIKSICIRSGSLIDQIYVTWTDGTISVAAGGTGGGLSCYISPTGCIVSAFVKHGSLVDGLLFVDSSGSMSQYFGGTGGAAATVNFGNCLKGIDGRSGSLIDRIRFIY